VAKNKIQILLHNQSAFLFVQPLDALNERILLHRWIVLLGSKQDMMILTHQYDLTQHDNAQQLYPPLVQMKEPAVYIFIVNQTNKSLSIGCLIFQMN